MSQKPFYASAIYKTLALVLPSVHPYTCTQVEAFSGLPLTFRLVILVAGHELVYGTLKRILQFCLLIIVVEQGQVGGENRAGLSWSCEARSWSVSQRTRVCCAWRKDWSKARRYVDTWLMISISNYCTHTHTRLMALCPGLPGWAGTRKDFTGARDSEWQWHQLGSMQVCTLLETVNHASTPPLKFFTGRMPFLLPMNSVYALKELL